MIPLHIPLYERGAGGVPGSIPLLFPYAPQSYQHTIVATRGFESMQVPYIVPLDVALDWLSNGIMRSTVVSGPEGEDVWEGFLTQIDATFGQEQRSVSLDTMGNRVRVKYTTVLDTPATTSTVSSTASQLLYGVKDLVLSVGQLIAAAAANLAAVQLADSAYPKMRPDTMVQTGDGGDVALTLTFAGWATAFEWVVTSNTSTTNTSTTTQVQTLTTAYNGVNSFFSTDYGAISSSGISDTEYIDAETTYWQKITKLLDQGTGSDRLAYGIYEDQKWRIATWAGASPNVITYKRRLGDSRVYDAYGNVVQPWNVRPDAMYEVIDLLDAGPVSSQQDAAARFYVERVTCTLSGDQVGVALEPSDTDSISARLARIG